MTAKKNRKRERYRPSPSYMPFELRPKGKFRGLKSKQKQTCIHKGCRRIAVRFEPPQEKHFRGYGNGGISQIKPLKRYCAEHYSTDYIRPRQAKSKRPR